MASKHNKGMAKSGAQPPAQRPQPKVRQTPPADPPERVGFSVSQKLEYQGPMPPQWVDAYDESESGRLILQTWAAQVQHRMYLEKATIDADNRRADRGLITAFVVALSFLACGSGLVYLGHDVAGGSIATVSVVGLVTAFIYGTNVRKSEREDKMKMLLGQTAKQPDEDKPKENMPELPPQP